RSGHALHRSRHLQEVRGAPHRQRRRPLWPGEPGKPRLAPGHGRLRRRRANQDRGGLRRAGAGLRLRAQMMESWLSGWWVIWVVSMGVCFVLGATAAILFFKRSSRLWLPAVLSFLAAAAGVVGAWLSMFFAPRWVIAVVGGGGLLSLILFGAT